MSLAREGILVTVIGMGTVFVALAALAVLVRLIEGLVGRWEALGTPRPAKVSPRGPETLGAEGQAEDHGPVVAAAVAAFLESESARVFRVPVRRPDRTGWVMDGRLDALSGREVS